MKKEIRAARESWAIQNEIRAEDYADPEARYRFLTVLEELKECPLQQEAMEAAKTLCDIEDEYSYGFFPALQRLGLGDTPSAVYDDFSQEMFKKTVERGKRFKKEVAELVRMKNRLDWLCLGKTPRTQDARAIALFPLFFPSCEVFVDDELDELYLNPSFKIGKRLCEKMARAFLVWCSREESALGREVSNLFERGRLEAEAMARIAEADARAEEATAEMFKAQGCTKAEAEARRRAEKKRAEAEAEWRKEHGLRVAAQSLANERGQEVSFLRGIVERGTISPEEIAKAREKMFKEYAKRVADELDGHPTGKGYEKVIEDVFAWANAQGLRYGKLKVGSFRNLYSDWCDEQKARGK